MVAVSVRESLAEKLDARREHETLSFGESGGVKWSRFSTSLPTEYMKPRLFPRHLRYRRHQKMKVPMKLTDAGVNWASAGNRKVRLDSQMLAVLLVVGLVFAMWPQNLGAYQDAQQQGAQ